MLDWLIIGGGIHGTYLSHYLLHKRGVPRTGLRVLDPHPQILARWSHFTANTGMQYLRSPRVHHLDLSPSSLEKFQAAAPAGQYPPPLGDYRRPAYDLFQAHTHQVIENYHLAELRELGQARGLRRLAGGWEAESEGGNLRARRVALAIGRTALHYPDWALALRSEHPGLPLHHLFEMDFHTSQLQTYERVVIIGGGISAAQAALYLSTYTQVSLICRHRVRRREFDSDPGWMGPKYLEKYKKTGDYRKRRDMIRRARHRGSLPGDVLESLRKAVQAGRIRFQQSEVHRASYLAGRGFDLDLENGARLQASALLLATGFEQKRPGGEWLGALSQAEGLPCAACGYPILSPHLCWGEGLYVSGPLAELEVGPVAPNIIGARLAAERIGRSLN